MYMAEFIRLMNAKDKDEIVVRCLPQLTRIVEILKQEGMGADCSSFPELQIADAVGLRGEEIMFTSNDTPSAEFKFARDLGAVVNFDDLTHVDFFLRKNLHELNHQS